MTDAQDDENGASGDAEVPLRNPSAANEDEQGLLKADLPIRPSDEVLEALTNQMMRRRNVDVCANFPTSRQSHPAFIKRRIPETQL